MRLTEVLKPENIRVPLVSTTKTEAITELVQLLHANGEIGDVKAILASVLEREATRSTGIGNGIAIPHGKCAGAGHLVMAVGKAVSPIEFQSIDGRPVTFIWLLTSPLDQTGPHIHALARISRLNTIESFRQALAAARSAQDVYNTIVKQEGCL